LSTSVEKRWAISFINIIFKMIQLFKSFCVLISVRRRGAFSSTVSLFTRNPLITRYQFHLLLRLNVKVRTFHCLKNIIKNGKNSSFLIQSQKNDYKYNVLLIKKLVYIRIEWSSFLV